MVIALQSYSGFMRYGAEGAVAEVVLISVTRELAPVLSALMVAGRIGAAMAAEIGTMRVTEQIDALTTLSTNPFNYLVAPRVWAGLIVMPILVMLGDVIGIFGGYVVGVYKLGFNPANYINSTLQNLQTIETLTKQLAITTTDKDAIQTENEQLKAEINSLKELLLDQQKTCRE